MTFQRSMAAERPRIARNSARSSSSRNTSLRGAAELVTNQVAPAYSSRIGLAIRNLRANHSRPDPDYRPRRRRDPQSGTIPAMNPETAARRRLALPLACLVLSGMAGLVAEVSWSRALAALFGSALTATGLLLAIFMGGLGLGSVLGGRFAHRVR